MACYTDVETRSSYYLVTVSIAALVKMDWIELSNTVFFHTEEDRLNPIHK